MIKELLCVAIFLVALGCVKSPSGDTNNSNIYQNILTLDAGQLVPDGKTWHGIDTAVIAVGQPVSQTYHFVAAADGAIVVFDIEQTCTTMQLTSWYNDPAGTGSPTVVVERNVPLTVQKGYEYFVQLMLTVDCQPSSGRFLIKEYLQEIAMTAELPGESEDPNSQIPPTPTPIPPPSIKYKVSFVGRPSLKDPCTTSFEWTKTSDLDVAASSSERLLRIFEKTTGLTTDLVWIPFLSETSLTKAAQHLKQTQSIKVASDAACITPAEFQISTSQGLILFGDDERVLVDRALAINSEIWKPKVHVRYRYREKPLWMIRVTPTWTSTEAPTAGSYRIFSRKSRTYLTKEMPLKLNNNKPFSMEWTDPSTLRRIIPYQPQIEILMKFELPTGVERKTIRLGDALLDVSQFEDLSEPQRSPFLVTEDDLSF